MRRKPQILVPESTRHSSGNRYDFRKYCPMHDQLVIPYTPGERIAVLDELISELRKLGEDR